MLEKGSDYAPVIFGKVAGLQISAYTYLKMDSLAGIFQGFWQLSRNTYLKEHFWTVSSKETKEMTASKETFFTHFKNFDT